MLVELLLTAMSYAEDWRKDLAERQNDGNEEEVAERPIFLHLAVAAPPGGVYAEPHCQLTFWC